MGIGIRWPVVRKSFSIEQSAENLVRKHAGMGCIL